MTARNITGHYRAPNEARRLPFRLILVALVLLTALAPSASFAQDRGDVPTSPEPELSVPGPDAAGTRHIANVTIRSPEDCAILQDLGFACDEGEITEVEVTEAQLAAIEQAGLEVTVVGLVATSRLSHEAEILGEARALEDYVYGANDNDIIVPAWGCESSKITITGAPPGAKVTRVKYWCKVITPHRFRKGGPGDYVLAIWPQVPALAYTIWNQKGGSTDQGFDDDAADDEDIFLLDRWIMSFYDGLPVNQDWRLYADDKNSYSTATIDYFKLWVYYCAPPSAPTLLSPAHTSSTCDRAPSFDWSTVSGASSYRILVDNNSALTSPEINANPTASAYVPSTPLAPGKWYWSVRAESSCGNSPYAPVRYFTIVNPPAAPNLLSPPNGAHTCDATPTFDWSTVAGASSYAIQVDNNPSFTTPEINANPTGSAYTPTAALAPGTYYWRVRTKAPGCSGGSSAVRTVVIDPGPAMPSNPSPAHTATGVSLSAGLHWDSVPGATSYDVAFGTTMPPPYLATVSSTYYDLPALAPNTLYYWKIVVESSCGRTHGPVWRFTTREDTPPPENTPSPTARPSATPTRTGIPDRTPTRTATLGPVGAHRVYLPIVLKRSPGVLSITLGQNNVERGLFLDYDGDDDTEVVWVGNPAVEARRTGNRQALPAADGNQIGDSYLQIRVDDSHIYAGYPTTRVRIEVEYLDSRSDTFSLQYDALTGGPFKDGGMVSKPDCGGFRTAVFTLNDVNFANRIDHGADFRIADNGDGAETIRRVTVTLLFP